MPASITDNRIWGASTLLELSSVVLLPELGGGLVLIILKTYADLSQCFHLSDDFNSLINIFRGES